MFFKINYLIKYLIFDRQLITIGILEPLAGDVIMDLIHQTIESEVQDTTKDNFGEHHISDLENVCVVIVYITLCYLNVFLYFSG